MKTLLATILLTVTTLTHAAVTITLDPSLAGQTQFTIRCNDPIARTDGTPLAVGEIAERVFWVSTDKQNWTEAGRNNAACQQVYDATQIADGTYYYTVSAIDTDGRQSIRAIDGNPNEVITAVVKRLPPPAAPAGLSVTVP